jgi:hypothetical protein
MPKSNSETNPTDLLSSRFLDTSMEATFREDDFTGPGVEKGTLTCHFD